MVGGGKEKGITMKRNVMIGRKKKVTKNTAA